MNARGKKTREKNQGRKKVLVHLRARRPRNYPSNLRLGLQRKKRVTK